MTDIAITIRLGADEKKPNYFPPMDVNVSEQDNSMGSIFLGYDVIKYTSIPFSLDEIITDKEKAYFSFDLDPEDGIETVSAFVPADLAIKYFEKIRNKLFKLSAEYLLQDLETIDQENGTIDEKRSNKKKKIGDYMDLWDSLSKMIGISKTAKEFGWEIQVVINYY